MAHRTERRDLRVGLAQLAPHKPDVAENLRRVRELMEASAGVHDLVVFPEACLSGYFLEGGVAEAARHVDEVGDGLGRATGDHPDVVLGFYERAGHGLFNSAAHFAPDGPRYQCVHVHRKMFLPTYGVFDEARFVDAGRDLKAYDTRLGRFGILICEEMWHSLPAAILAVDGAELILVVSASPARDFRAGKGGRPGNLERWDRLAPGVAVEHGVFVAVSQLVGSEGGKIFPGGSVAVGPDGSVLARGPLFEESVTTAVLHPGDLERARFESPLLEDLRNMLPHLQACLDRAEKRTVVGAQNDPPVREGAVSLGGHIAGDGSGPDPDDTSVLDLDVGLVERTLVRFIREEVERRGFERVVLGVSGGVDSSVSLYLAVRAVGAHNVHAFRLPYSTSSSESLEHAERVAQATGAHLDTIDISEQVDAFVVAYDPDITPLRKGNLMARTRGVVLFDRSAVLHALPLGTGNKSERLLGYFTWHADDSPPINPLGDLFKTQVWALAVHLGVPDEIVEKPASADLVRGVHDEDELGIAYHRADPILYWLLRGYSADDLVRWGFEEAEVALVWRRLSSTHWKRELPTVAVLSSTAIGEFYLRPVDY